MITTIPIKNNNFALKIPAINYHGKEADIPGVPVRIISPGNRVKPLDSVDIISGILNIILLVRLFCFNSPFSHSFIERSDGSTSDARTMQGPSGQVRSSVLPLNHCKWCLWRSESINGCVYHYYTLNWTLRYLCGKYIPRAVTSLAIV